LVRPAPPILVPGFRRAIFPCAGFFWASSALGRILGPPSVGPPAPLSRPLPLPSTLSLPPLLSRRLSVPLASLFFVCPGSASTASKALSPSCPLPRSWPHLRSLRSRPCPCSVALLASLHVPISPLVMRVSTWSWSLPLLRALPCPPIPCGGTSFSHTRAVLAFPSTLRRRPQPKLLDAVFLLLLFPPLLFWGFPCPGSSASRRLRFPMCLLSVCKESLLSPAPLCRGLLSFLMPIAALSQNSFFPPAPPSRLSYFLPLLAHPGLNKYRTMHSSCLVSLASNSSRCIPLRPALLQLWAAKVLLAYLRFHSPLFSPL